MTTAVRRSVIYARLSLADLDGEEVTSDAVKRQVQACHDLARAKGFEVVAVHTDDGVSAYAGRSRPGFDAVLDAVARGEAEVIVCWDLDRLARRLADLQRVHDLAGACPTLAVETVRGQGFSLGDAGGRMLSQILTLVAEHESAHRGERVAARARQRALSGALPAKTYGYDGSSGEPVEPAASAVKAAFAVLLSTHNLARARDALVQVDPAAPASRTAVRAMLTRPAYAGLVTYRGAEMAEAEATWTPLVSQADYRRAQAILSRPARRYAQHDRSARSALLTGLATCGRCGRPMRVSTQSGGAGGARYPVYVCDQGGDHLRRRAREVEAYVVAVAMARLGEPDAQAAVLPRDPSPGADSLAAQWGEVRARRAEVADLFAAGLMDRADYVRAYSALSTDLAVLEDRLATLQVEPETGAATPADPAFALVGLGLGGLRAVVDTLMTVRLDPARRGRQPFDPTTVVLTWRRELPEQDTSGLTATARPDEDWWEQIQDLVDGGIGHAAEDLVTEQPPPPLSAEQRRALWVALVPAADRAPDAETATE